jgi:type III secretion protein V
MLPVVTPIALEIAFDLIPEDDQEWIFLKTYVPKMRDRLQKEMGIRVPGVRVRGNETDLSSGTYIIMLDEVPLVSGTLEIGRYYCLAPIDTLQALGIAEYDLSPAPHPGTSAPGCWVAPEYETIIVEQGLELWADHQLYMLYHLDAVLRSNLADFVGVQEIANLVEVWAQEEDGAELVAEALPDDTARLRFGRVLRALLDEQVSIAPWREILEAVREVGLPHDDVHEAVKAVRLRLKPHLPGNGSDAKRVFVPEYLEEKISSWIPAQDDIGSANIPPEETQYLMNEIREFVQRYDQDLVLVARESEVRPFMRRLVQMEFPHIVVIAEEERLPPDELAVLHSQ